MAEGTIAAAHAAALAAFAAVAANDPVRNALGVKLQQVSNRIREDRNGPPPGLALQGWARSAVHAKLQNRVHGCFMPTRQPALAALQRLVEVAFPPSQEAQLRSTLLPPGVEYVGICTYSRIGLNARVIHVLFFVPRVFRS